VLEGRIRKSLRLETIFVASSRRPRPSARVRRANRPVAGSDLMQSIRPNPSPNRMYSRLCCAISGRSWSGRRRAGRPGRVRSSRCLSIQFHRRIQAFQSFAAPIAGLWDFASPKRPCTLLARFRDFSIDYNDISIPPFRPRARSAMMSLARICIRRLVTPSLEASSTIDWTWRSRPMIHLSRLPFHLRFGRATALAVDGLGTALRTSATATPVRT